MGKLAERTDDKRLTPEKLTPESRAVLKQHGIDPDNVNPLDIFRVLLEAAGKGIMEEKARTRTFIKNVAAKSLAELHELQKKAEATPLTPAQEEIFRKLEITKFPNDLGTEIRYGLSVMHHGAFYEVRHNTQDYSAAGFELGKKFLKEGRFVKALECFEVLACAYLDDSEGRIPKEIGEQSMKFARAIARCWVFASALDYSNIASSSLPGRNEEKLSLEGFEPFMYKEGSWREPHRHTEIIFLGGSALDLLTEVGGFENIPAIKIVQQQCWESGLEGRCSSAMRGILVNNAIAAVFDSAEQDLLKLGLDCSESTERIVSRLTPLIGKLGISYLFSAFPGLEEFGVAPQNPVDAELAANKMEKLAKGKFGTEINANWQPSFLCERFPKASEEFALANGLIEAVKGKEKTYRLTPKGEAVIKRLLSEIPKLRVVMHEDGVVVEYHQETHQESGEETPKQLPPPAN